MDDQDKHEDLLGLTTEIVAAYVSHNSVEAAEIGGVIDQVYKALAEVNGDAQRAADCPPPAVAIADSVTPDYLICLEDGKKLKMLKRHLMSAYDLTPAQYRERWGLPADYPMVAPSYAEKRSRLAKDIGLGKK